MLSIQTNVSSINAQENLRMTNEFQARTISRLTSGFRINQSGDDAAGLAVANKFRSDIAELSQGVRNANDGLSTMQIIDGGLSNISKMLDRLKTLATQSASSTFEGNRGTLNNEYSSLLTEIDRQASNVGLGNTAGASSRYNKLLNVYIGGGSAQANSGVKVDLSAATDKVSGSSLGIAGTSINGGWVIAAGSSRSDLSTATLLAGNANQVFTVNVEGNSVTATIQGGASGVSGYDAVTQLNNQISSYGISAVIDAGTGSMNFVSDKGFTVTATDASSAGTGLTTGASTTTNTAMYSAVGQANTFVAVEAGNFENFTVALTTGGSVAVSLSGTTGATLASALTSLNSQLSSIGVSAVKTTGGNGIQFMSASDFTVTSIAGNAGAANGVFANATNPTIVAPTTTTAKDTTGATAAISAISAAVSKLGVVQGKVGTAQNKISYAIQLAQSQITNFSAAESRIRDADIAQEAANLTKAQVLSQASMAALAQANSAPQSVLSLLRG